MNPNDPTNQEVSTNNQPANNIPPLPLPPTPLEIPTSPVPPSPYAQNNAPSTSTNMPIAQRPDEKRCQELNLTEGEGIICEIDRNPIGLVQLYCGAAVVIVVLLALLYLFIGHKETLELKAISDTGAILAVACIAIIVGLVTTVAANIYKMNKMILTNESLIIQTQQGLFNTARKSISLNKIEDVSYKQSGLLQSMFGYGTITVSTMGDEGLEFRLAKDPKKHANYINNAHEEFERRHSAA
jgi:hypothetical protein